MAANIPPTEHDFELLSAYLDNQLSAQDLAQLQTRLAAEPTLRATLNELRQTVAVLNVAPQIALPRNFTLDVARFRRPMPWWARYQTMQLVGALGAVASVVLIVAGAALFSTDQETASVPAAAKLSGSTSNNIALAPTETATRLLTLAPVDKVVLPTATLFVPTLVPSRTVAENAAGLVASTPTALAKFSAQSASSGGAPAPAPQAAQSGAAVLQPPHAPETTTADLAQAQATFADGLTETPHGKDQLSSAQEPSNQANEASDAAALKPATAQSTVTVPATMTLAPTGTVLAVVPTTVPAPAVLTATSAPQAVPSVPIVLIVGIAILVFSLMLFAIGWLRSRMRG